MTQNRIKSTVELRGTAENVIILCGVITTSNIFQITQQSCNTAQCSTKAEVGNVCKSSSLWHETLKEATRLHYSLSVFVVALSVKSSLHQRFTTRPNGCRESCSGVNWSVSARLKPADGVACSLSSHRGQFYNVRLVTCFNSASA